MGYREVILRRVLEVLPQLVVQDAQVTSGPDGQLLITPNDNYTAVLRDINVGFIENLPVDNPGDIPIAFVDLQRGRNDLGIDTFLSHVVEVLSISIQVLLEKKIGVNDGGNVRPIAFQVTDLLHDIQLLVNKAQLASAVNILDDVTVQDVILEEWERDERYRGGDQEVLNIVFQAEIANLREQS